MKEVDTFFFISFRWTHTTLYGPGGLLTRSWRCDDAGCDDSVEYFHPKFQNDGYDERFWTFLSKPFVITRNRVFIWSFPPFWVPPFPAYLDMGWRSACGYEWWYDYMMIWVMIWNDSYYEALGATTLYDWDDNAAASWLPHKLINPYIARHENG